MLLFSLSLILLMTKVTIQLIKYLSWSCYFYGLYNWQTYSICRSRIEIPSFKETKCEDSCACSSRLIVNYICIDTNYIDIDSQALALDLMSYTLHKGHSICFLFFTRQSLWNLWLQAKEVSFFSLSYYNYRLQIAHFLYLLLIDFLES